MKNLFKKTVSLILAGLMIFTMLPNFVTAEENTDYTNDVVSVESTSNNLFELQAFDSEGNPLAGGQMTVYSYLENKTVGGAFLDDNGKATFNYQPSLSLIEKVLAKDNVVDVQYAIFITDGEEVYIDGFTQTYYSSDFFKGDNSLQLASNSIMTNKVQSVKAMTKKPEDIKNLKKVVNSSSEVRSLAGEGTLTVLESRSLGNKQTDLVYANAAVGCSVTVKIESGTKTTLSGSNILTTSFTGSSQQVTSTTTNAAGIPCRFEFFTYYSYVEERIQWTDGYSTITYTQARPTSWVGGLNYVTYSQSKNGVSPATLTPGSYVTYAANTTQSNESGTSLSLSAALSVTGPLSGGTYTFNMTHVIATNKGVSRLTGNTTYFEYGTGKTIVDKYITRY